MRIYIRTSQYIYINGKGTAVKKSAEGVCFDVHHTVGLNIEMAMDDLFTNAFMYKDKFQRTKRT